MHAREAHVGARTVSLSFFRGTTRMDIRSSLLIVQTADIYMDDHGDTYLRCVTSVSSIQNSICVDTDR